MSPKTVNDDFEYVSSSSGDPVIDEQPTNEQPTNDQPIIGSEQWNEGDPPSADDAILLLSTRDELVKYITEASVYLNGKAFTEESKTKMTQDKCDLLFQLTSLSTKGSQSALQGVQPPMAVLDVTWNFVASIRHNLNTNLEHLIFYSASHSISDGTRKELLKENNQLINALLSQPVRVTANKAKFSDLFKDPYTREKLLKTILVVTFLVLIMLNAIAMLWRKKADLEQTLAMHEERMAFQEQQLAYLKDRLEKSKTCLNMDGLLEKSKELFDYDAIKEKSKVLFDSLGVRSKDVYGDLDSFKAKGKRYLNELFTTYWG